jgi:hypothetical protein
MNYLLLIWFFGIFVYVLYLFVISWFSKEKMYKKFIGVKEKHGEYLPFVPKKLFELIYFNNNKSFIIWYIRIIFSLGLLISAFILFQFLSFLRQ